MNKQLRKRIIEAVAVGAVIMTVVLVLVMVVFFVFVSSITNDHGVLSKITKAYKRVALPTDLKHGGKTQTGDPIDSPDQLGWVYDYTSSTDAEKQYRELDSAFAHAGFQISNFKSSQQDPSMYPVAYAFTASDNAANVKFDVAVDSSKSGVRDVSIAGSEIHYAH